MLTLPSQCFVAEKITHDRSLSVYQMSLSGFFSLASKRMSIFLALNESPLTQEHQFHRAGRHLEVRSSCSLRPQGILPIEINTFMGTAKAKPKNTIQFDNQDSMDNNPMNPGTGETFFLVKAPKD